MSDTHQQDKAQETDTPLWRFALTLWQQEEAREFCLVLQQHGWSVTRLLCAGWLASQGLGYSGTEPDSLQQWRRNVTESVRSLRKSLSKSDSLLAPLRETLARAELEAERIELYRAWLALGAADIPGPSDDRFYTTEFNLRQAAPDNAGSVNKITEPMIRHLAQLIESMSIESSNPGGGQPA